MCIKLQLSALNSLAVVPPNYPRFPETRESTVLPLLSQIVLSRPHLRLRVDTDSAWTGQGHERREPGAQRHGREACFVPALASRAGRGSGLLCPWTLTPGGLALSPQPLTLGGPGGPSPCLSPSAGEQVLLEFPVTLSPSQRSRWFACSQRRCAQERREAQRRPGLTSSSSSS